MDNKALNQTATGDNNQQAFGNINNNNLAINTFYIQTNCSSDLVEILLKISKCLDGVEDGLDNIVKYEITHKIDHNKLIKYKQLVNDYSVYGSVVDSSFESLDNESPMSKKKIYRFINLQYKTGKAEIAKLQNTPTINMDFIRNNSDNLMDYVSEKLKGVYFSSSNSSKISIEDAIYSINIIVCKAFIDCKILENPN